MSVLYVEVYGYFDTIYMLNKLGFNKIYIICLCSKIPNTRYMRTPSKQIRLAQMMHLALMARGWRAFK